MKNISNYIKPVLALIVILLGFAYFYLTTFMGISPNDQILIAIIGLMSGAMGYYFGASTGTSKKDETISDLAKKQ